MAVKQAGRSKQDVGNVALQQGNNILDNVRDSYTFSDIALGVTCRSGRPGAINAAREAINTVNRVFAETYGRAPRSVNELFTATASYIRSGALDGGRYSADELSSAANILDYVVRGRGPSGELDLGHTVPRRA